jgi:transposase
MKKLQDFKFSYATLANLLPEWKRDPAMLWLKECPSQALQQSLKNLESSFRNFFAKRADFLHKTSTEISKNHAIICIEDLRIGNMSKSAH